MSGSRGLSERASCPCTARGTGHAESVALRHEPPEPHVCAAAAAGATARGRVRRVEDRREGLHEVDESELSQRRRLASSRTAAGLHPSVFCGMVAPILAAVAAASVVAPITAVVAVAPIIAATVDACARCLLASARAIASPLENI